MAGRRICAIGATFAAAIACTSAVPSSRGVPAPSVSPPAIGSYAHDDPPFSISYPGAWAVSENVPNAVVGFYPPREGPTDPFPENVEVVREPVSGATTLNGYTELSIRNAGTLIRDFKVTGNAVAQLSGEPAIWVEYTGRIGGQPLRFLAAWTIQDGAAWVVTYTALPSTYGAYVRQARSTIASFQLG